MCAAAGLHFFLVAQASKLSPSESLVWAEGALKRGARNSGGDEVIGLLSEYLRFWLDGVVLVCLGRSSWLRNWARGRHDLLRSATAGIRCAMVCRRRRGYGPGRPSLRFAFCRLNRGRRRGQRSRQAVPGVLSHRKHAMSCWANSLIGFDFEQKAFGTCCLFRPYPISQMPKS